MGSHDNGGVMGSAYAAGREKTAHLSFRFRVRAEVAISAYLARADFGGEHRVLDLGAAEGRTLLEMRRLLGGIGRYDGIELSEELIAAAPALPEGVRLWKADVTKLPAELPAETYTLATALAVLEHLPDPLAALREAWRLLRPGGVLVASCPHPIWDHVAGALRMVADEHHEQELDEARLLALAHDAGFGDVEYVPFMFAGTGFLPYLNVQVDPRRSLRIDRWVKQKLPWAKGAFVNQALIAVKPGVRS